MQTPSSNNKPADQLGALAPCETVAFSPTELAAPFEIVRGPERVTAIPSHVPEIEVAKPEPAAATILLVEDEATIRGLASAYLQKNGYDVIEAANGAEAMMLWQKHGTRVDLVLTDLMIPGDVKGPELVRRLQAERPCLKAVAVSGYAADAFDNELFLDATVSFLAKPYRLKNLLAMVHDCLGRGDTGDVAANPASPR